MKTEREVFVILGQIDSWERTREKRGDGRGGQDVTGLEDEGKDEEHGRGIRGETNRLIFVRNMVIH